MKIDNREMHSRIFQIKIENEYFIAICEIIFKFTQIIFAIAKPSQTRTTVIIEKKIKFLPFLATFLDHIHE